LPCTQALLDAFNSAVLRLVAIDRVSTTFAVAATSMYPAFAATTTAKNLIPPPFTEAPAKNSPSDVVAGLATHQPESGTRAADAGGSIGVANHPNNEADSSSRSHNSRDDGSSTTASRSASFSARELGTYLGISFAVLLVLCAMAAFMTWKALEGKRRRTGSEFDADDTPMAANGFELDGGADAGTGEQFHEPVPIIDDEELRWKGCDVELSPTDSGVASMGSPFTATDHDAAILFGPEGALTPSLHVPHMLDDGDGDAMTPTNMKKRAYQAEADAAAAAALDANGGGPSSAGPSSASTSYEPSSPIGQSVGTPIEASSSFSPPLSSSAKQRRRSPPSSMRQQTTPTGAADASGAGDASKSRRRAPKQPELVAASRNAISSFMSGGSHTRHLVYETAAVGSSAGSSASTTAVSSPMDRTPSPAGQQQQQQELNGCVQQTEPSLVAYSNIKLLET
jgi:hypothetical protein